MSDADSGYYTCNDGASSSSSGSSRSSISRTRTPSNASHHSNAKTEVRHNPDAPARASITSSHSSKRLSSKSASIHRQKARSSSSSSSSSSNRSHKSSEADISTAQRGVPAMARPVHIGGSGPAPPGQHVLYQDQCQPSVHIRSSPDFSSSSSSSNRNSSVSSYTSYTEAQPAYRYKAYSKISNALPISYKQEGRAYYERRHHTLRSTSIESIFEASAVYSKSKKVRRFRLKKAGPTAFLKEA